METNIIIAGIGGQGSILLSRIIASALIAEKEPAVKVRVGETFGAAQRGGAVASHIRAGEHVHGPLVRRGAADIVIALEPLEAMRIGIPYIAKSGTIIMNSIPVVPIDVKSGAISYPGDADIRNALEQLCRELVVIDGKKLTEEIGNPRVLSVLILGAAFASGKLPVSRDALIEAIKSRVPVKTIELNMAAFELGEQAYVESER